MASITLRNLALETLEWLRKRAFHHRRSLNSELLELLEMAKADELAEKHAQNPFAKSYLKIRMAGIQTPSSAKKQIREDRDSRVRDSRVRDSR